MHPILFELGPITIYSYGVLLAAAYLLGLWLAARRARHAGLDANKVLDLGIWVIIAALVGAKALLFIVDFEQFTSSWQEFTTLLRSGGVFYGGLIAAVRGLRLPVAEAQAAAVDVGRPVRPRHRARLHGGPARMSAGRLLLRQADRRGLGGDLHRSGGQPQRRHAAQYPAASDAALRVGRGASHPAAAARSSSGAAAPLPGRTFWLFVLLYSVSRFVIEFYRGDDRGMPLDWLSTSQLISLVLFPLSLIMLWYLSRPSRPPAAEAPARPRKPRFA